LQSNPVPLALLPRGSETLGSRPLGMTPPGVSYPDQSLELVLRTSSQISQHVGVGVESCYSPSPLPPVGVNAALVDTVGVIPTIKTLFYRGQRRGGQRGQAPSTPLSITQWVMDKEWGTGLGIASQSRPKGLTIPRVRDPGDSGGTIL
jgi:hypothetical protein